MNSHKQTRARKERKLRNRAIPVLILILVLAITITLFLLFQQNPEKIKEFERYGYSGAFIIGLVSTATIILPVPGILLIIALGTTLNPVLIGLISAMGGSIGEMTGYMLGRSGRGFTRNSKIFVRAEGWMRRRGFITIFLFSLIPFLPLDIVGVVSGILRFPIWKFLLAGFLGKTILHIVLIRTGTWGWDTLLHYIG
ncbi:TVP38/TMEM64 family protein [Chloroflexota bacterium]